MILVDRYDHKNQFYRRNYVQRNYRIKSIMNILKFSYLNLNTYKWVQVFWEVMLLDRGVQ